MDIHCHVIFVILSLNFFRGDGATASIYQKITTNYQEGDNGQTHHVHHHHYHISPKRNLEITTIKLVPEHDDDDDDDHYPYEEVRNFVSNNPLLKSYFTSQSPQIGSRGKLTPENDMPNRDENLCRFRENKVLFPKKLKNINEIEKLIVNIESEFEQAVQTRTCVSDGQCTHLKDLPLGFTTYCAQEYMIKELMVYNSTTTFDLFKFPSCCVCKIKRT